VRIPYVSLRFQPLAVQDWGINVARETRRNGYKSSWAPLTQNLSSGLAQIGTLRGLTGLRPGRLVELNPVATAARNGRRAASGYERLGTAWDAGLNARIGITQNLVADATLNPDFSHVEADAGQITANERFALSVPEKRPFFLEGTSVFQTPHRLVHTRSILNPAGGAKLSGKVGATDVAYLGALDESSITGESAVNLVRLRRDIGSGSTGGVLFTDRSAIDGAAFNRVAGADVRISLRGRYTVAAQAARSWTRVAASPAPGGTNPPGDAVHGDLAYLAVERTGRTLGLQGIVESVEPEFVAGSGFVNRTGFARLFGTGRLNFYRQPGSALERWGVDLRLEGIYRHEDFGPGAEPIESEIELQPNLFLRGGNTLRFIARRGGYVLDAADYARFRVRGPGGELVPIAAPPPFEALYAFALLPSLRPRSWLQLGGRLYLREIPIFSEGSRGFEFLASPDVKVWPTEGLSVELSWARTRLRRTGSDELFSAQDIPRLKAQYQFSRALFARVVGQYNLQRREPLRDPGTGGVLHVNGVPTAATERGEFGGQFLLSYEHSPGTLVYLGWSQQMRGASTWRIDEMVRQSDGLFVKFSYLVRR
jgi:hypothetical protein